MSTQRSAAVARRLLRPLLEIGHAKRLSSSLPRWGAHCLMYSSASRQRELRSSTSPSSLDLILEGKVPEGLKHVLRCEVDDLVNRSEDITSRKPPKPFILVKDEPNDLEVTISRIYGVEDISMSCGLQMVPKKFQPKPEVGEDPEAREKMVQLTVMITKNAPYPVLIMKCECYRFGFVIHQVDLKYDDEEETVYRPYFSETKRELCNQFQIFLYERGLNADLVKYIEQHLEKKRLLKSAAAFQKMERFVP